MCSPRVRINPRRRPAKLDEYGRRTEWLQPLGRGLVLEFGDESYESNEIRAELVIKDEYAKTYFCRARSGKGNHWGYSATRSAGIIPRIRRCVASTYASLSTSGTNRHGRPSIGGSWTAGGPIGYSLLGCMLPSQQGHNTERGAPNKARDCVKSQFFRNSLALQPTSSSRHSGFRERHTATVRHFSLGERMILRGTDDTLFELEVVGYQFPHMENDEYGYDAQ